MDWLIAFLLFWTRVMQLRLIALLFLFQLLLKVFLLLTFLLDVSFLVTQELIVCAYRLILRPTCSGAESQLFGTGLFFLQSLALNLFHSITFPIVKSLRQLCTLRTFLHHFLRQNYNE